MISIMDIVYDPHQDFSEVIFYTKVLRYNKNLCLVCLTDEIEDGHCWDRYQ
jgi:hypothetical protein